MEENRDVILKVRMTAAEKESLKNYAEEHSTTMSELIRELCARLFIQKEQM